MMFTNIFILAILFSVDLMIVLTPLLICIFSYLVANYNFYYIHLNGLICTDVPLCNYSLTHPARFVKDS